MKRGLISLTISELVKNLFSKFTKRVYSQQTDKQHVSNKILKELRKGIKKGEGIPALSKRIQGMVNKSRNRSILTARTETTRIQSRSRMDAFDRARSLGIIVDKQWVATSDGRTRDSHAAINGEIVADGESFSNGLYFPGDPNAPPEETCNCRCTLAPVIRN